MAQIEVDFEVWKSLVGRFENEHDSFNEVIRRLLELPASDASLLPGEVELPGLPMPGHGGLLGPRGGVWYSNCFFPDGTTFRATYKGKTYRARIQQSQWIDELGHFRTSPSDAAGAVTGNNVNGWRFWFVKRPADDDWQRMDAVKP